MLKIKKNENNFRRILYDENIELEAYPKTDRIMEVHPCTYEEVKYCLENNCPSNIEFVLDHRYFDRLKNKIVPWMDILIKKDKYIVTYACEMNRDYPESRWGKQVIFEELKKEVKYIDNLKIKKIEKDYENTYVILESIYDKKFSLDYIVENFVGLFEKLVNAVEISLSGFFWKEDYYKDEELFSKEIIEPLLRRMKFTVVKYLHGNNEFGKDFIFSEIDKFGFVKYYGLQVKAGNVDGGVNSKIDTIISQIEDAFTIPFVDLYEKEEKYISELFVTISGRFTNNAKVKIINKINKDRRPFVKFIDQDYIKQLVEKYREK